MLINCPKCGFSQPKDQFCAQCGVDMQSFKPKEKPALQQILSSTVFQISLLVMVAVFIGQQILQRASPTKIEQRNFRSQGISKSQKAKTIPKETNEYPDPDGFESLEPQANAALEVSEKSLASARAEGGAGNSATNLAFSESSQSVGENSAAAAENTIRFKLIYAEVPTTLTSKWIVESSNLGYYQSLPEYSIGAIESELIKKSEFTELKSAELKVAVGTSQTNLAGQLNDDGSQLIGLATTLVLKLIENNTLIGHINVAKGSRAATENYPADFELPKGTAFFIMGALKLENFQAEKAQLQMPPFQILKSSNFLTRKTEFVIVVVPDYK